MVSTQTTPSTSNTPPMRPRVAASQQCLVNSWAAALCWALFSGTAFGQPGVVIFSGKLPEVQLSASQVSVLSSALASRLDQAAVLVRAKKWDEAVEIYRGLAAEQTDRVVAIDENRFVSLGTFCQMQLAKLPPPGLAAYRQRVDAVAERLYREGLAARDEKQLHRVIGEFFCSSWGDDALLTIGELALERGDFAAARTAWEQISPLLRDPSGKSLWLALCGIDLNAKWADVDRAWQSRKEPPEWLAFPDTTIDLAEVRARLLLVSIRAGDFERAAVELDAFRRWHPAAEGRLGGQQVALAAALEKLLAAARQWKAIALQADWPTFAGSQTRSAIAAPIGAALAPAWEQPIDLKPLAGTPQVVQLGPGAPPRTLHEPARPLEIFPIAVEEDVVFADAVGIHAADPKTGKPTIAAKGLILPSEPKEPEQQVGQLPAMGIGLTLGVPRFTLNAAADILYARAGDLTSTRVDQNGDANHCELVGLDLRREGLLAFRAKLANPGWSFDGVPVRNADRLYVALRHGGATTQAAVACFDAATGDELWRTSICSADTPAGGLGGDVMHNLLTLASGRIYFNTNLGVVAAMDCEHGAICWLTKYPRATRKSFTPGEAMPPHFERDPSPCCYSDGLLFIAPADTPSMFALDADTGKTLWTCDAFPDAVQVLGVKGQGVVASGTRLAVLDICTGKPKWIWPKSNTAEIRGTGRGLIAGNEVFWPARNEIYAIDLDSGVPTRQPIDLSSLGGNGANLAAAAGRLIVAGYDKLMVLAPAQPPRPQPPAPASADDIERTGRLSHQSIAK